MSEAGSEKSQWFAARTRYGQELLIRDRLEKRGYMHFIPTEERKDNRGRLREHPTLNCLVFLRATKEEACALKVDEGLPVNYLFDYARHSMMVVPDKEMEDFQRVFQLSVESGGLMEKPLRLGERVRVVRGVLKGVEGYALEFQGRYYVVVGLCGSVFAKARVPRAWLEKVEL